MSESLNHNLSIRKLSNTRTGGGNGQESSVKRLNDTTSQGEIMTALARGDEENLDDTYGRIDNSNFSQSVKGSRNVN